MPSLLVSVRSAEEARAAVEGGVDIVDVKEPDRGPLGRASGETWRAVRAVVPGTIPVSVALGELRDFDGIVPDLAGIAYCKLGLAGSGSGRGWVRDWAEARRVVAESTASIAPHDRPRWVAVIYSDWAAAGAPDPRTVLAAALAAPGCAGLLIDTWDKSRPSPPEVIQGLGWMAIPCRDRLFLALAGGLDLDAIDRLASLRPDYYAVRGAACIGSDRRARVDAARVAGLYRAVKCQMDPPPHGGRSATPGHPC